MRQKFAPLSLVFSLAALLAGLWIVVPAPARWLWLWAVAVGEWSLWLAALGLSGAALGLWARRAEPRRTAHLAIVAGLCAVGLGLYPLASAWRVARANGVALSARRYFLGATPAPRGVAPQTVVFNQVDGQELRLDVYLPALGATSMRPAVIVVHGGGWDSGAKSDFPQWNYWLAQQGYAVFDIEYRLRPQPNWQSATGDVKCAVGWVKRNAAQYGVDARRVALLGRSAGGHLALLAGYTTQINELPASCGNEEDTSVRAVIAFYAPTDMIWDYENPANQRVIDGPGAISNFVGGTPETNAAAYIMASPVHQVNAQTPPTLLLQSGTDQLVLPENVARLRQSLQAARVPHRAVIIPYAQHGFDYNFNGWGSQIVQPLILQFLQEHLAAR